MESLRKVNEHLSSQMKDIIIREQPHLFYSGAIEIKEPEMDVNIFFEGFYVDVNVDHRKYWRLMDKMLDNGMWRKQDIEEYCAKRECCIGCCFYQNNYLESASGCTFSKTPSRW